MLLGVLVGFIVPFLPGFLWAVLTGQNLDLPAAVLGLLLLIFFAFVYRRLGWQKVGEIPEYAAMPDGELRATAYYYKRPMRPVLAAGNEMRDKKP